MQLEATFRLRDAFSQTVKTIQNCTQDFAQVLERANAKALSFQHNLGATRSSGFNADIDNTNAKINNLGKSFENTANQSREATNIIKNGLNNVEKAGKSASVGLSGLKSVAGAFLGFQAFKSAFNLSDQISSANARLSMITSNLSEQKDLQAKIMNSANRSRSSYLDMANATAKMKMLAPESFKSNEEALAFTEALQKSLTVSGADKASKSAAFLQITQAMTSGRLQGDEFRSMTENAPMVADAIAKYMGKSKAELKSLSSQGLITADIVKNALLTASDDINKKFNSMPRTFSDVMTDVQNKIIAGFEPISKALGDIFSSEGFSTGVELLSSAIVFALQVVKLFVDALGALTNNFDIILPLLPALVAIFLACNSALIANGMATMLSAVATGAKFVADMMEYGAILMLTIAQDGFNAALLACPISWIIIGIMLIIGAFYSLIAIINKTTGTTYSATGMIVGAFFVMASQIANQVIMMYNLIAMFVNFFANCFTHPIASIKILFLDLARHVIGVVANIVKNIESLINLIPGVKVNISSGITKFAGGIDNKIKNIKNESGYKTVLESKSLISMEDAYKKGYGIGKGFEKKAGSFFGGAKSKISENPLATFTPMQTPGSANDPSYVRGTGKNGAIKVENDEDLDLLRSLAMRDYIAKVSNNTLAPNISIEFSGPITKEADTDKMISKINEELREIISTASEG